MENSEIQTDGNQNENPKTSGSFLQIFFEPAQCFAGINKKPVFLKTRKMLEQHCQIHQTED